MDYRYGLMWALLAATSVTAQAGMYGGVDFGWARNSNFTAATGSQTPTPESIWTTSANLGYYIPSAQQTSAVVFGINASHNRFGHFTVLDNNGFGGMVGFYHRFTGGNSLFASAAGLDARYANSALNTRIYSGILGLRQPVGPRFWFGEGVTYQKGYANTPANAYHGVNGNVSLNWTPWQSTLLSASAARETDTYDVSTYGSRTLVLGQLSLVQQLGRVVYVRGSAARVRNAAFGIRYWNTLYTLGVGASF